MPPPDDATRLYHILDSACKAAVFVRGKSREDLDSDELLALALVRLLEVIGEASTGITERLRAKYPEIPWREMANTRNRLIHGYFDISYDLVWETITKELPPLTRRLKRIFKEENY
ncbi:MAG: DUF86 domain-containing protein [Dehalococcoidales bacterium]|nr:DUF86 domain-containing protein [Dehalococcoidales bacterium]